MSVSGLSPVGYIFLTVDSAPLCGGAKDALVAITALSVLRNLPAGAPCQTAALSGAAWKCCILRSTLSPFTAASPGKHMAAVEKTSAAAEF